jgi:hypothetical protein
MRPVLGLYVLDTLGMMVKMTGFYNYFKSGRISTYPELQFMEHL